MHTFRTVKFAILLLAGMCLGGQANAQFTAAAGKVGDALSIVNTLANTVDAAASTRTEVDGDLCWKASYGRGVGEVPPSCRPGQDRIGLLCYSQCPAGMKRFGLDCHSTCPQGMRDDGLFCRAAEYGRGAGYAWQIGDHAIAWEDKWWAGMTSRCERDHGAGKCERGAGIVYPKCAPGFTAFGANICRPSQPNCQALGMNPGVDLSCAKKVLVGDPQVGICRPGQQGDAGLCYGNCSAGFSGAGPVCWGKCEGDFPFECGMGCAVDEMACAMATTEQVVGVLSVAATVTSTALTLGAATAAGAPMQMGISSAAKQMTKSIGKTTIKTAIKTLAKDAGKSLAMSQLDNLTNLAAGEEFDPTSLDPTGIASMVKSFVKPVCGVPGSATPGGTSGSTAPPVTGQWTALPGSAVDVGAGGSGTGSIWHVGGKRVPGGYAISRWNGSSWNEIPGGAVRIDVDGQGNAWVLNDTNTIFRWTGNAWSALDGQALDVGVGANGTTWVIGTSKAPGGYAIHRRDGNTWKPIPGAAVRIDVDPRGNAWVVNDTGSIFRWTGSNWAPVPGSARDIGIGGDGSVFIVGTDGSVQKWSGSAWVKRDGGLQVISVDPSGIPYGANAGNQIWKGYR